MWKPAAGDALATPRQTLKSVVKMLEKPVPAEPATCAKVKPWIKPDPAELASCGKRRGRVITEKLQEIAEMSPAASSWYPANEEKKKQVSKKPMFLTPEEQEAHRRYETCKDWVVHHQEESIGECYTSLKRQAHRYNQEVRALRFFHLNDDIELACKVLAIADWAEEYNQMDIHPIPAIPPGLLEPYSSSLQARGQFPPAPDEEPRVTDVRTRSQAMWIFLCSILQYFEDDMAAQEGALYSGKTRRYSALVLYIMVRVNPGLPEHYQVHWHNIVGKTPWLVTRNHMSKDEFQRFYQEPYPEKPLELELATEDVYRWLVEYAAQKEVGGQSLPLS